MEEIPKSGLPPRLRIGIAYNLKRNAASELPDGEAEYDEYGTILAIKDALEEANREVELFEATEEFPLKLAAHPVDIVFNIAEGSVGRGREAQVPAVCNLLRIPFTGSDETTLCIALDKALTKRILATYHITTPKYQVIRKGTPGLPGKLAYPVIVKPNAEGSSKGISNLSLVSDQKELRRLVAKNMAVYKQDMLVEEYIEGREFTVGIVGNGEDIRVFSPMEILFRDRNMFYSYEVKKDYKTFVKYECPAKISGDIRAEIENTAKRVYEILDCKDFARIDFRLSPENRLYFIEINPLPGLAPGYSDFPMNAERNGIDYTSLIRVILNGALKRYHLHYQ
jgi:D-alanine-D-alanine ligase